MTIWGVILWMGDISHFLSLLYCFTFQTSKSFFKKRKWILDDSLQLPSCAALVLSVCLNFDNLRWYMSTWMSCYGKMVTFLSTQELLSCYNQDNVLSSITCQNEHWSHNLVQEEGKYRYKSCSECVFNWKINKLVKTSYSSSQFHGTKGLLSVPWQIQLKTNDFKKWHQKFYFVRACLKPSKRVWGPFTKYWPQTKYAVGLYKAPLKKKPKLCI